MFNIAQWVNWEPVQYPGEPKPRKIPCGGNNPHDPANWTTWEQARATSALTGFVLTANDPYFFIDLDHCRLPDGSWSEFALTVISMFPGAYVEVGFSGDGLHIIGQGVMPEGFQHKNQALGLEIYDRLRYVAVTQSGCHGSPDVNHQAALTALTQAYMAQAAATVNMAWTNTPRHDWDGPLDDGELVQKMLSAKPSMNVMWGSASSIKDLWEGNAATFIDCYPDGQGGYDASSPDMALASHLAFWTGCDCERIARLMWQSGLVRPKWTDHKTYLNNFTIVKAVSACQNVYSDPRNRSVDIPTNHAPLQQPTTPVEVLTGVVRQGYQYLTPDAQIDYFKGCVYIISTHRVLRPNGTIISPEQFKAVYGGYEFSMDASNLKTTKCAWEAFTRSRAVSFPMVEGVLFRPELEPGAIIEQDGFKYVNTYYPAFVRRMKGDVSPFYDLLTRLFPDERDRLIIISYMAAVVQHIGHKFQWCPLIQGCEGNGKSFFTRALIYAIGDRHSHLVNPKDLANKFNSWIEGKVFAGVEEVYVSDRRDAIDALKIMITNDRLEIQPKGGNQYMGDNRANFLMNTNHKDAIRKTTSDRRYSVNVTPHQTYNDIVNSGMGGDYFPDLYRWAKADGYAIIADHLLNFQIPDELNPTTKCHRAPNTSTTHLVIEASKGPVEQEIENAIGDNVQGFRGGWISAKALDTLLVKKKKSTFIHLNKRSEILSEMGYEKVGRASIEIPLEGVRPTLYLLRGTPITNDITFDYMKAQGYITS